MTTATLPAELRQLDDTLDIELDRCGWKQASRHFDNACDAALRHDDLAFTREMKAFRAISNTRESTTKEREGGNTLPSNHGN